MRKVFFSALYILILIELFPAASHAQSTSELEIDAIRQDVSRLYSSTSKKVSVKMRSGTKIKGYIDSVGSDTFTLRIDRINTEIRYANVASVSRTGFSKNQKTALVIAGLGAATTIAIVFRPKRRGGFGIPCLLC